MPIKINFLWWLLDPAYAIAVGLAFIFCISAISYIPAHNWPKIRRSKYTRYLGLASDVLASVGVIGLLTFAARAYIETELRTNQYRSEELQREARVQAWKLTSTYCLNMNGSTPQTLARGCHLSAQLVQGPTDFAIWWSAKEGFMQLSETMDTSSDLNLAYRSVVIAIDRALGAQDEVVLDVQRRKIVESDISWILIAICSILAMVGIGLKWTRALLDFRKLPGE